MKKIVKLGLAGCGTVGQGVARILENNRRAIEQRVGASVEIAAVCDLRGVPVKASVHTKRYQDLVARPDLDIVVELMGGYEPARTLILESLRSGKNVVTANKAVLARYWDEIFTAARDCARLVYFEASVAGAIPVIQGLNEGLAANRIQKITGILNGTTNYILSEMTRNGIGFETALKRAQKAGFAEADPSFDVDGIDTANKLAILSSLAWSGWVKVGDIAVTGIRHLADSDVYFAEQFGYVIKLLGSAAMTDNGLSLSVQPCLVPVGHPFATVEKEYNAVSIQGDAAGDVLFYGRGAGQLPAASAVVSDIIFLARQVANGTAGKLPYVTYEPHNRIKILPPEKSKASYYLRFSGVDRPGVLAKIAGILGKHRVSIASVYQEEPLAGARRGVPILMLTHAVAHGDLMEALRQIDALPIIKAATMKLRIE